MNNFLKKVRTFEVQEHMIPVVLLVATIFTYGLLFWQLGFYWDDVPMSWIGYQLGPAALTRYFSDSRPIWAYLYQLTTFIIPQQPVYWQLFALFWRWIGAVVLRAFMSKLLPDRKSLAIIISLLMLVYPGFNQQWVSYVYSHLFVVFFFLLMSWYLMLRKKTIPALIFAALNLLMLEYFFMLELMRPFILWISYEEEALPFRERMLRVLKAWVPYLVILGGVLLYKALIFTHPGFGYSLKDELVRAPLETIAYLFQRIFSSLWTVTVEAWVQVFQFPNPVLLGVRTTSLYLIVVLLIGSLVYWCLPKNQIQPKEPKRNELRWVIIMGVIMLLLGGVPFWVTDLPVSLGFPANRATLSFMLGVSFVIGGLLEFAPVKIKYAIVIIFVALASGRQFLWSNEFRHDWADQKSLFWQMTWRAPGLEKNTTVLINEELKYYSDNSLDGALNWIYNPDTHTYHADYALFYPTSRSSLSLNLNTPITYDQLAGIFEGNTSQAIVFYYAPPKCLRLLDPQIDAENHLIPDDSMLRDAAKLSSTTPILNEPIARMPEIYGPEPAHGWCYFFEKADLARQLKNWDQVASLGDSAFQLDDYPNDPIERFVFIEGYADTEQWKKAVELSKVSYKVSKNFVGPPLCKLWERIQPETKDSPERQSTLQDVNESFGCKW